MKINHQKPSQNLFSVYLQRFNKSGVCFAQSKRRKKDRFADEFKKVLAPDLKKRNDVIVTEKMMPNY
jgi:hypothetical protein